MSTLKFEGCTALGTTCTVETEHLAWATELTLVGIEFLDFILKEPPSLPPGWLAECLGADILCEFKLLTTGNPEDYSVDLSNLIGLMIIEFLQIEEAGPCFENGKEIAADMVLVGIMELECLDKTAARLECAVSEA